MFIPDQSILRSADPGTSFLVLFWKEIFDPYTPDTFQPRLYNVPALLNELREVAAKARKDERWRVHQNAIQEEIEAAIEEDCLYANKLPYFAWACRRLANSQDAAAVQRLSESLQRYRSVYEKTVTKELERAAAGLPRCKGAAADALRRIATIALDRGHGEQEVHKLCNEAAFKLKPSEWVGRLLVDVESSAKESLQRDCIIAVFGVEHKKLKKILGPSSEFEVITRSSLPFQPAEELRSAVFVKAVGLRGATETRIARSAVRGLRPVLDVFGFYERTRVTIGDMAWIGSDDGGRLICIAGECLRKLPPRKHSSIRLARDVLGIPSHCLSDRIVNALEHYSLAQANSAFRVKLVNLWSAIECLCSSEISGNVIERVRKTVTPIVLWRRIDKITRYVASTLTRFRQSGHTSDLGPGFLATGVVTAEEVLLALCKTKDHPNIARLLAGTSSHPLLTNRIYTLWRRFSDPQALLRDMIVSRRRTDWHLLRIYRARNLIVHEGHELAITANLVDNLEYYFSVTLSRVLHGMALNHGWEVEVSANHWQSKSDYVLDMLRTSPQSLRVKDFFPVTVRSPHEKPWLNALAASSAGTGTQGD